MMTLQQRRNARLGALIFGHNKRLPIEVACISCRAGKKWDTTPGSWCDVCQNSGVPPIPMIELEGVTTATEPRVFVTNKYKDWGGCFYASAHSMQ